MDGTGELYVKLTKPDSERHMFSHTQNLEKKRQEGRGGLFGNGEEFSWAGVRGDKCG
jgi:hypothetical protein